jgi:orotidine-5'-phosphate decarboxylase
MSNLEKVIVALDLETPDAAIQTAEKLASVFPFFKIGSKLFTLGGPDLIRELLHFGKVFLDLKFYDIPSVIAGAVEQAARLGVSLLTLHASGGSEMMKQSAERVKLSGLQVRLLGVTVLTSFSDLSEFGIARAVPEQVRLLADLARSSGMDGIVCSPAELPEMRSRFPRPFVLVTPGIRGLQDEKGDQKRTASAPEALRAGADYLVIGRPIIAAQDPVAAANMIAEKIKNQK